MFVYMCAGSPGLSACSLSERIPPSPVLESRARRVGACAWSHGQALTATSCSAKPCHSRSFGISLHPERPESSKLEISCKLKQISHAFGLNVIHIFGASGDIVHKNPAGTEWKSQGHLLVCTILQPCFYL